LAVSINEHTIKSLCIIRGVTSLRVPSFQGTDGLIEYAVKYAKVENLIKSGEPVLAIQGLMEMDPEQSNVVKILTASK
jgi:pyruvate kinase